MSDPCAPAPPPRRLAVVGAGTMGSGIAQKMATEGFAVTLVDVDDETVARGVAAIERDLAEATVRGIFDKRSAAAILGRIRGAASFDALADADLVVEAVFEDLDVKRSVFRQLDRATRPDAILATNTSSYSVGEIAEATARPERVVGLHYFYHPAKNRLVEVVAGVRTDPAVRRRAWMLQERLGKTPIASRDSFGFIVNRFFSPWLNEAVRLLEEGAADAATIDAEAKATFGIGMGPFELMNVTGLPIALHTAETLGRAFGAMYEAPALLRRQVGSGERWPIAGATDVARFPVVADRLLGMTFYVASALVDEQVGTMEDADIGARVGLRWRRGPFELMNEHGMARAATLAGNVARRWHTAMPGPLEHHARTGRAFALARVRVDTARGVATITINRPDAMNALDEPVVAQLADAFHRAASDATVRAIVIAAAGKSFVAGADIRFFLRHMQAGDLKPIVDFTAQTQQLFAEIARSPKPVVARVHGLALGGGVELALACHAIVATPRASLAFPETGIGIYPGLGGTQRTTRRVGIGLAKWLVLTGQRVSADEAFAIGLVDRVVPHEDLDAALADAAAIARLRSNPPVLDDRHRRLADFFERTDVDAILAGTADTGGDDQLQRAVQQIHSKAPEAARIAAHLIERGASAPLDDALRMELEHVSEIFSTKEAGERLRKLVIG